MISVDPETIFLAFMCVLVLVAVLPTRRVYVRVDEHPTAEQAREAERVTAQAEQAIAQLDDGIDRLNTTLASVVESWERLERARGLTDDDTTVAFDPDETIRINRPR